MRQRARRSELGGYCTDESLGLAEDEEEGMGYGYPGGSDDEDLDFGGVPFKDYSDFYHFGWRPGPLQARPT